MTRRQLFSYAGWSVGLRATIAIIVAVSALLQALLVAPRVTSAQSYLGAPAKVGMYVDSRRHLGVAWSDDGHVLVYDLRRLQLIRSIAAPTGAVGTYGAVDQNNGHALMGFFTSKQISARPPNFAVTGGLLLLDPSAGQIIRTLNTGTFRSYFAESAPFVVAVDSIAHRGLVVTVGGAAFKINTSTGQMRSLGNVGLPTELTLLDDGVGVDSRLGLFFVATVPECAARGCSWTQPRVVVISARDGVPRRKFLFCGASRAKFCLPFELAIDAFVPETLGRLYKWNRRGRRANRPTSSHLVRVFMSWPGY